MMTAAPQWIALALGLALLVTAHGVAKNISEQEALAGAALPPPAGSGWSLAGGRFAVLP